MKEIEFPSYLVGKDIVYDVPKVETGQVDFVGVVPGFVGADAAGVLYELTDFFVGALTNPKSSPVAYIDERRFSLLDSCLSDVWTRSSTCGKRMDMLTSANRTICMVEVSDLIRIG